MYDITVTKRKHNKNMFFLSNSIILLMKNRGPVFYLNVHMNNYNFENQSKDETQIQIPNV